MHKISVIFSEKTFMRVPQYNTTREVTIYVTSLADYVCCLLLLNYCSNKTYRIQRNYVGAVNISRNT